MKIRYCFIVLSVVICIFLLIGGNVFADNTTVPSSKEPPKSTTTVSESATVSETDSTADTGTSTRSTASHVKMTTTTQPNNNNPDNNHTAVPVTNTHNQNYNTYTANPNWSVGGNNYPEITPGIKTTAPPVTFTNDQGQTVIMTTNAPHRTTQDLLQTWAWLPIVLTVLAIIGLYMVNRKKSRFRRKKNGRPGQRPRPSAGRWDDNGDIDLFSSRNDRYR